MLGFELKLVRRVDVHVLVHHLRQFRVVERTLNILIKVLWRILTVLLLILTIFVVV